MHLDVQRAKFGLVHPYALSAALDLAQPLFSACLSDRLEAGSLHALLNKADELCADVLAATVAADAAGEATMPHASATYLALQLQAIQLQSSAAHLRPAAVAEGAWPGTAAVPEAVLERQALASALADELRQARPGRLLGPSLT